MTMANWDFWATAISRQDGSLQDGIQLLWTAPVFAGYSVDGYDIQRRREHWKPELTCHRFTAAELQTLHTDLKFDTSVGLLHVRGAACPTLPDSLPDDPFTGDDDRTTLFCVDFQNRRPGTDANPRTENGLTFRVLDDKANALPNSRITSLSGNTGLDCAAVLEIELPQPTDVAELTLVQLARSAQIVAFDAAGSTVDSARLGNTRGQQQTITLAGKTIRRVVVTAPQNETLLLEICVENVERRRTNFRKARLGRGPNPRTVDDISFYSLGANEEPNSQSYVSRIEQSTGLLCGVSTVITLPRGARSVELALVSTGDLAKIVAVNADGTVAQSKKMTVPDCEEQTLQLAGRNITRVTIHLLLNTYSAKINAFLGSDWLTI